MTRPRRVDEVGLRRAAAPRGSPRPAKSARPARMLPRARRAGTPRSSTHSPIGTMSPVSSASGMNSAGATSPRSGCCQRTSASAPTQRAVGERDDRLEEEPELAALERAVRARSRSRCAVAARARMRVVEHLDQRALPRVLGAVHRGVGVAEQLLGRSSPGRPARCRRSRRRTCSVAVEHERRPDRLEQPLGDLDRVLLAASRPARSSHSTVNSSPPKRATVSPGRITPRAAAPTSTSSSSPASWPRLSLTFLKRSRSRNSTATRCAVARGHARARG